VGAPIKLERQTFETSRQTEYFDRRELQTMTGQPLGRFPGVVLKELLDNALDAAETAGVRPRLSVQLCRRGRLVILGVRDNGGGIPAETVAKVLNFRTRTSDKAAYRSPTRGAQGNALKTILGIPVAMGVRCGLVIRAQGVRHRIRVWVDPAGEVRHSHVETDGRQRQGTLVTLALPARRCDLETLRGWGRAFALFNPHAAVSVRIWNMARAGKHAKPAGPGGDEKRDSYHPTVLFPGDRWRKFLPTDLTSPWWYDASALGKLVFAHVGLAERGGPNLTTRDFVRQFRGLSPTAKAKRVCLRLAKVRYLRDFADQEDAVPELLRAMQAEATQPSPGVLGLVGEEHLRSCFESWFGVRRWWYKKVDGHTGGVPYVVEVALAVTDRPPGRAFHGVNFSPTFEDPLASTWLAGPEFGANGVSGFVTHAVGARDGNALGPRVASAFHLACPALEFLDKGKTRLKIPEAIRLAVIRALWACARELYREAERRRKDAARQERADRRIELAARQSKPNWTLKDAVFHVMREAVQAAAGSLGRVSAHTLFYHVRPRIQPYTDRELTSDYFEQTLLPAYRREVGPLPEVYYEPRGVLYEPHTGKAIPLGTREVESYNFPSWLYDKILFVEKKGLWPVFEAARLAERYDMAVVAGEGYASEACRVLFASAKKDQRYQLFVVHDADPHGYNIGRTLREETERMPDYRVEVNDLGLRLADAIDMGLLTEEFTRKKALPSGLKLDDVERKHFVGRQTGNKSWVCQRVELNAFSGPGLIAYVERGLVANGVRGKVIPPDPVLVEQLRADIRFAVRAAVAAEWAEQIDNEVERRFLGLAEQAGNGKGGLREEVAVLLQGQPNMSWRTAVGLRANEIISHQ
jgi:DNA topoisomerase VI subunit B